VANSEWKGLRAAIDLVVFLFAIRYSPLTSIQ
jgi:hypothetical protein